MSYTEAVLYGLIQGVAEYLPISSSAHLILLPRFMATHEPGLTFDVFLHLATLAATLTYFWKEWAGVARTLPVVGPGISRWLGRNFKNVPQQIVVTWKPLLIATLPALVVGAIANNWIETTLRSNSVIVVTLILGGLLLFVVDRWMSHRRTIESMTWKDALLIGLAQCCALIPGVSRSGATMTAARALNLNRTDCARFSFLMSAPVVAAAVLWELRHLDRLSHIDGGWGPVWVAFGTAFVSGIAAIGFLLKLLKRMGYFSFAFYRLLLAVAIYVLLLAPGA